MKEQLVDNIKEPVEQTKKKGSTLPPSSSSSKGIGRYGEGEHSV